MKNNKFLQLTDCLTKKLMQNQKRNSRRIINYLLILLRKLVVFLIVIWILKKLLESPFLKIQQFLTSSLCFLFIHNKKHSLMHALKNSQVIFNIIIKIRLISQRRLSQFTFLKKEKIFLLKNLIEIKDLYLNKLKSSRAIIKLIQLQLIQKPLI